VRAAILIATRRGEDEAYGCKPEGWDRDGSGEFLITSTPALASWLNHRLGDHERTKVALLNDWGRRLVPTGIMAEIAYLVERRLGTGKVDEPPILNRGSRWIAAKSDFGSTELIVRL